MKRIKLTQNKYALIDDEDFEKINQFKWYAHYYRSGWRAIRNIRKSNGRWTAQLMHRLIMNTPEGMDTDHENHNGLDNQKHNLRVCTNAQNQHNQKLRQLGTTSSHYRGVYWHKAGKKWAAQIQLNNKQIHLGLYPNEITAAKDYDIKATKLFGKFACLNFR